MRALGWATVALVACYLALGVYFYLGSPSPSVNYIAKINESGASVPAEQRAWPLYREALLMLGDHGKPEAATLADLLEARPGWRRWPEVTAWLERNAPVLERIRAAAERPTLGFIHGPGGDAYDPALYPKQTLDPSGAPGADTRDRPLISVLLPYLHELRVFGTALAADAAHAREAGDRERLLRDVGAILKLAGQMRADGSGFLVVDLVALGIQSLALREIERTLADRPALLTDANLRDLAHQLSGPRTAADLMSLRGERMFFADVIQRVYTDDGAGNGRMTPEGLQFLSQITSRDPLGDSAFLTAVGPSTVLLSASRREVVETYDRLMDEAEARLNRPLYEAGPSQVDDKVMALKKTSGLAAARYLPISILIPSTHRVHETAERYLGQRDGLLVAIALELFHRRSGRYPASLEELAPGLLPEVPRDRISGGPLRYRLVDGRPVVYSVGADGDDDGGRGLAGFGTHPYDAANWHRPPAQRPDADWVLFPPPPDPDPEPEGVEAFHTPKGDPPA
jgi:hypothetical protein